MDDICILLIIIGLIIMVYCVATFHDDDDEKTESKINLLSFFVVIYFAFICYIAIPVIFPQTSQNKTDSNFNNKKKITEIVIIEDKINVKTTGANTNTDIDTDTDTDTDTNSDTNATLNNSAEQYVLPDGTQIVIIDGQAYTLNN